MIDKKAARFGIEVGLYIFVAELLGLLVAYYLKEWWP